ncbi:MAG: hypothetical protein ABJQ23_19970 [Shimia thalassica]|uniref:hypothetical protein n=1 Tax=Pseudomonadota TaxID=1224 RepID=UPI00329783C4
MRLKPTTMRLSPEAREALARLRQRYSRRSLADMVEVLIHEKAVQDGCWVPRSMTSDQKRRRLTAVVNKLPEKYGKGP